MKRFNFIGYFLVFIIAFGLGVALISYTPLFSDNAIHEETIKELSFKDIGTLSTQEAYITVVENMNDVKQILGLNIPGTKSVCIFSHDFLITAGYNFEDIKTEVTLKDGNNKGSIVVYLPDAQILTNGILSDKEKVYYESESIFNNLKEEDNTKLRADMGEKAKEKYTGLEGYAKGGSFTKYFLVFEKDNERIVLNCTDEQYGLIKVEDEVQVNYKVINNKEKWLDSYKLM